MQPSLSLDAHVYLLYLCLCTDFTGFVCIYTTEQHLESISSKRFFFKRPHDCYGPLLALPCALIAMDLLLHLFVS